jgi:uncharacterized membrane protein
MIPLLVLVGGTLTARIAGAAGLNTVDSWPAATRVGLALMLVLTASAHFLSRRADLIRMVPPGLPSPPLLVTITGLAELAIAVGLVIPTSAPFAASALVALLIAMFPANVHAARAGIPLGGKPPMPLVPRTVVQLLFVGAAALVIVGGQP